MQNNPQQHLHGGGPQQADDDDDDEDAARMPSHPGDEYEEIREQVRIGRHTSKRLFYNDGDKKKRSKWL